MALTTAPPGLEERLAAVDAAIEEPPQVHPSAPEGVFSTSRDCYEFLARHSAPGARTLETGLGTSTVLFASFGTDHTCVVPSQDEVDDCVAYCEEREIDSSKVSFEVGSSDEVLPELDESGFDLFLIDGLHGFPMPIIDWYYGASRLRAGGHVVLDDRHLAQVSVGLVRFMSRDPRWTRVGGRLKWAVFRRETGGSLTEEYIDQGFLERKLSFAGALRTARNVLSPLRRRVTA